MDKSLQEEALRVKYLTLRNELDERGRRVWAALEASILGHGGIALLSRATGLSVNTINQGIHNLSEHSVEPLQRRVRRSGGGRKRLTQVKQKLCSDLMGLVDPMTRGHPQSPLLWTCKSTRKLAKELTHMGHNVSHSTVAILLSELGYNLQAPRKVLEGKSHPDRDAQFLYISKNVKEFQERGDPVVSVDCKKKENLGRRANGGKEWQPEGQPEKVDVHDFPDPKKGKAIPYGVYDLTENNGWVSVGSDNETSKFAVETIVRWWETMGKTTYPQATSLLITADGGGSNGSRRRAWKTELQAFAKKSKLKIKVCHFPPGTSKWNKIEHRLFSQITKNWRGRPLESHEIVVNLIANTTTTTGLKIRAELNEKNYEKGLKITDQEMDTLNLVPDEFHGEWNYTLAPEKPKEATNDYTTKSN